MITTMDAPWSSSRVRGLSNKAFALVALLIMFAGVAAILGANARANGFDECRNWSVIGDTHGVGIASNGIEEKLRERGAANVEREVYPRQSIEDINDRVRSKNFDGRCVIVEAGTGNLANDDGRARESINRLLSTLSGATKVYWVTPLAATDATDEWDTENFLRVLNDTQASNLQTIDIQGLAERGDLFDPTRVTMTNEGYKQRIQAILDGIAGDDTPPETTPTESSPPPGDDSAPGGDNSAPGGDNTTPESPGVGEGPISTGMTPAEGFGTDGFRGDPNKVSPRAFADRVDRINHFAPAADYLTVRRWASPPVPTPAISIVKPSSFLNAGAASVNNFIFGFTSMIMSFTFTVATAAFSPGWASTALGLSDRIFGLIFGGFILDPANSNIGGTGLFLSSLVMLSIIFAVIGIFSNPAQLANPRRALGTVALSVGKYMVVITFLLFMGWSSSRNHGGTDIASMNAAEEVLEETKDADYTLPKDSEAVDDADGLGRHMTTRGAFSGTPVIDAPGSWHAFSLGWFVSWCYYVGNLIGQTAAGIPRVITGALFDISGAIENKGPTGTSCDRYVDAMHFAFMKTAVADRNGGVADLLRTIDLMHYDLFFRAYSGNIGGPTTAAGNSWCIVAEQDRQTAGGDWLMLARTAGLYKEAAGTGNLLHSDPMTFADGQNRISVAINNIQDGLTGPRDGYLVRADGNWITDDPRYAMPLRAEQYMGMTGDVAAASARYYFAACEWDPYTNNATLGKDWAGVRAMGVTGTLTLRETSDGEDDEPKSMEMIRELSNTLLGNRLEKVEAMDQQGKTMVPESSAKAEEFFGRRGEFIKREEFFYLQDYDCLAPRNFPIGAETDTNKFGWGAGGPYPNRWDYSPLPPKQLGELLKGLGKDALDGTPAGTALNIAGSIFSAPQKIVNKIGDAGEAVANLFKDEGGDDGGEMDPKAVEEYYASFLLRPDDEPAFDRDTKFGSSRDPDTGKMYASHYARVSAGGQAAPYILANFAMLVASILLAFLVLTAASFGFIVNFMMSLFIMVLSLALVVVIGVQLFRFNRFNPNRKGAGSK